MPQKNACIIVSIVIMLFGCSIKRDIPGKYMFKKNSNFFQLNNDSTFIYEFRWNHAYQRSVGKWGPFYKGRIILNSNVKSTNVPIRVGIDDQEKSKENRILFDLSVKGGLTLRDHVCQVYINDSSYCVKRCDSLKSLVIPSALNSIYLKFYREPRAIRSTFIALPLISEKYYCIVKTKGQLKISAEINGNDFFYKTFNNYSIKVKYNKILIYDAHKGRWEKLIKKPDSTNMFIFKKEPDVPLNSFL